MEIGDTREGEDIVYSAWRHAAGFIPSREVAYSTEYKAKTGKIAPSVRNDCRIIPLIAGSPLES